jgi:hypothetical protein
MAGRFSIGRVVVVVVVVQAEAVVGSKLKSPSELSPKTFRLQLPCGTGPTSTPELFRTTNGLILCL